MELQLVKLKREEALVEQENDVNFQQEGKEEQKQE